MDCVVIFRVVRSPLALDVVVNVAALSELNPRFELGEIDEVVLVCVDFLDDDTEIVENLLKFDF